LKAVLDFFGRERRRITPVTRSMLRCAPLAWLCLLLTSACSTGSTVDADADGSHESSTGAYGGPQPADAGGVLFLCSGYVSGPPEASPLAATILLPVPSASFDAGPGLDLPLLEFCFAPDAGFDQLVTQCEDDCKASLASYAGALSAEKGAAPVSAGDLDCKITDVVTATPCP
jgi:hypothetical protein